MFIFKKKTNTEADLKDIILAEIEKEDVQIIQTAYCYAKNLHLYGVDVSEKWDTTIQQTVALEKAKNVGYYKALEEMSRAREIPAGHWIRSEKPFIAGEYLYKCSECGTTWEFGWNYKYCPHCGVKMEKVK